MTKKLITLNVLNILDIITTYIALDLGLIETNFLMEMLMLKSDLIYIVIKLGLVLGGSMILYKAKSKIGFILCNIIFSLVVLSNLTHILIEIL